MMSIGRRLLFSGFSRPKGRSISHTLVVRRNEEVDEGRNALGTERWHEPITAPGSAVAYGWLAKNERVHLPLKDETAPPRPAYVCHMRTMIKHSPKRMWYYASFVRGLSVDEALKQLQFIQRKGTAIVQEVIEEAIDLAINEHDVEYRTNLWVAESFSNVCDRVKGYRRHARMRVGIVEYKYVNYFVRLEEGIPPKNYYSTRIRDTPQQSIQKWIEEHRQKRLFRM